MKRIMGTVSISALLWACGPEGQYPEIGTTEQSAASQNVLDHRWRHGVVPYESFEHMPQAGEIEEAIDHWNDVSEVQFVERNGEVAYIHFAEVGGTCNTGTGNTGGSHVVNLSPECDFGAVLHELGHVLGLHHEQSRTDRDEHVRIHWSNINEGDEFNFWKYNQGTFDNDGRNQGPYDIQSIMHYSPYSFTSNGLPTITLADGVTLFEENRETPSPGDICGVHKFNGLVRPSDIDGDGYDDLVVGVPGEGYATLGNDHGGVQIIFGSASGVSTRDQFLQRESSGVEDVGSDGDQFGYAVAVADFNADCYADVAVGVPYDEVNALVDAGSVHIFYGASYGLSTSGDHVVHPALTGVAGDAASGDTFGYSLAAGDFDGDGYADLAVSSPLDDEGSSINSGSVTVLYGSADGIVPDGSQIFRQGSGLGDSVESYDQFGFSLAAGDFNRDGFDELAVGAPYESLTTTWGAGTVHIIKGSVDGLTTTADQTWISSSTGVGASTSYDFFGYALAAGDIDQDGFQDLAIGEPYDDVGSIAQAGTVTVLMGTILGLTTAGSQLLHQDVAGVYGTGEAGDYFGFALELADFDGDDDEDLAVGIPGDDILGENAAGAVSIIYSTGTALSGTGSSGWYQSLGSMASSSESNDQFGYRLRAGDFNGDYAMDLAIGVPTEDDTRTDVGAVHIMYGVQDVGLDDDGNQLLTQDSIDILDTCSTGEQFGLGL